MWVTAKHCGVQRASSLVRRVLGKKDGVRAGEEGKHLLIPVSIPTIMPTQAS